MAITITIGGESVTDYHTIEIKQIVTRRASSFKLEIFDTADFYSTINYNDELIVSIDSTMIFKGLVETRSKKDDMIVIEGRNYWVIFLERHASESYTDKTASYMLGDIIDKYCTEFTKNITTTTKTYDRVYRNVTIAHIIAELCSLESFQAYVDLDLKFVFETTGYNDTGKTFDVNTGEGDVLNHNFKVSGSRVKNVVTVYGKPGTVLTEGIAAQRRNNDSIALYGEKHLIITDHTINTLDTAEERAQTELDRFSVSLESGWIEIDGDENIFAGDSIYFTCSELSFSSKKFLVIAVDHKYPPFKTKLTIADLSLDISDLLQTFLKKLERMDTYMSDYSTTVHRYELFYEEIEVTASYIIEKQILSGIAEYNVSDYNTSPYGPIAGSWNEIASGNMVITNKALEVIRDWLCGDSETPPDNTNGFIGIGTGTTPPTVNDTNLETGLDPRQPMDSGYPTKPANYEANFQVDIASDELNGNDLTELGLFNAVGTETPPVGGDMFCRQVFDAIAKNDTFALKMRINLKISAG